MHEDPLADTDTALPAAAAVLPGDLPAGWPLALSRWSARPLAAGQDWDAVRIAGGLAPLVYSLMRQQTCGDPGPVVIDAQMDAHYWLIRTGFTARWDFPGVTLLTNGTWVVLPPTVRQVYRVHWLSCPDAAGHLAHAPLLHATVTGAVAS
ncbi:hypothetical protein [Streptacidiphilus sp. EB129]|uniref:hypothetical protein n=1 Tax=Streptacidiphilus sp. EB129 TaxID=3156262 RepID=UPI003518B0EF